MKEVSKPPKSDEFTIWGQGLLWSRLERWLVAHPDLSYTFYESEKDSINGRYHNFVIEIPSSSQSSFGIRVCVYVCQPMAVFRLGYWGECFGKQERKAGSFFSIVMTDEAENENWTTISSGLSDDLYIGRLIALLDDTVNGKIRVNVTKLGKRPVRWSVFQWSSAGWVELGVIRRNYSLLDCFKAKSQEQLTFKGIGM